MSERSCISIPADVDCRTLQDDELPMCCQKKRKGQTWISRDCKDYLCPFWDDMRVRDPRSVDELLDKYPVRMGPMRMLWREDHFDNGHQVFCIDQWWDRMVMIDDELSIEAINLCDGHNTLGEIISGYRDRTGNDDDAAKKKCGDFFEGLESFEFIYWKDSDGSEKLHHLAEAAGPSEERNNIVSYRNILAQKKLTHMETPVSVYWNITHRCDGRCIMCFADTGKDREKYLKESELTTKEVFNVLEQMRRARVTSIVWGGGEPFMREDFLEILAKCRECGIGISLPTNGIKLGSDPGLCMRLANILRDWGYVFQVSFESHDPKVHNKIRPGAPHEVVLQAIETMLDLGIIVTINTVAMKPNLHTLKDTFDFVRDLEKDKNGLAKYRVIPIKPIGLGKKHMAKLGLTPQEHIDLMIWMKEMKEEYNGEHFLDERLDGEDRLPIFMGSDYGQPRSAIGDDYWGCPAGKLDMNIHPDGSISPCSWLMDSPEWNGPSVKDHDIIELWHNAEVLRPFRAIQAHSKCLQCSYNIYCSGGCPALNYNMCGTIDPPDAACWYEPDDEESKGVPEFYPYELNIAK